MTTYTQAAESYTGPRLSTIVKAGELADMVTYAVNVTYPGETPRRVMFQGTPYGVGPVVMFSAADPRGTCVIEPSRFGPFGPEWVRRFFTQ